MLMYCGKEEISFEKQKIKTMLELKLHYYDVKVTI